MKNDKRLIEDYLPIQAISKEASREKSIRKGHISTLQSPVALRAPSDCSAWVPRRAKPSHCNWHKKWGVVMTTALLANIPLLMILRVFLTMNP